MWRMPCAILLTVVAGLAACSPRDPYATMCGAAMDTASALGSARLAMESIGQGNAGEADRYRQLGRAQAAAASGAIDGIDDSDIRSGVAWRSIDSAAARVNEALDTLPTAGDVSVVDSILDAASDDLARVTEVLPAECLIP